MEKKEMLKAIVENVKEGDVLCKLAYKYISDCPKAERAELMDYFFKQMSESENLEFFEVRKMFMRDEYREAFERNRAITTEISELVEKGGSYEDLFTKIEEMVFEGEDSFIRFALAANTFVILLFGLKKINNGNEAYSGFIKFYMDMENMSFEVKKEIAKNAILSSEELSSLSEHVFDEINGMDDYRKKITMMNSMMMLVESIVLSNVLQVEEAMASEFEKLIAELS